MAGIIKKMQLAAGNRTTYKVGLLQTKAYRLLKLHTNKALAPRGLSSVHWAFMGLMYDTPQGIRLNEAAKELGVEAPFVTAMFADLKKKQFAVSEKDPSDSRAKIVRLTPAGQQFVSETEPYLRSEMRTLLGDTKLKDILSYLLVLENITKNGA